MIMLLQTKFCMFYVLPTQQKFFWHIFYKFYMHFLTQDKKKINYGNKKKQYALSGNRTRATPLATAYSNHWTNSAYVMIMLYGLRESNSGPTACEAVVITN